MDVYFYVEGPFQYFSDLFETFSVEYKFVINPSNTILRVSGVMANVGAGGYYQIWSAKNSARQSNGGTDFTTATSLTGRNTPSMNFRIFWDGDLYDNLLDGANITDWNGRNMSNIFSAGNYDCVSINGTKANPSLQADLFGDWREEVVYPTSDGTALRVFSTTDTTDYKIKTLMQDPVYRSGVAAEQTAYNQPPHVGFYMGKEVFDTRTLTSIAVTTQPTKTSYVPGESFDRTGMVVKANYSDGTSEEINTYTVSEIDKDIIGEQTLTVSYLGKTDTITIYVVEPGITSLNNIYNTNSTSSKTVYCTNRQLCGAISRLNTQLKINSMPADGDKIQKTVQQDFS